MPKSRWDMIEIEGKEDRNKTGYIEEGKSSVNKDTEEKDMPSINQINLPNVGMIQDSIETNNSTSHVNISGWLSQISLGQILMALLAIPVVIALVSISVGCIKFFTSPIGGVASVVLTGVLLVIMYHKGMFPF